MELKNEFLNVTEAEAYLKLATGIQYNFFRVTDRKWGKSENTKLENNGLV